MGSKHGGEDMPPPTWVDTEEGLEELIKRIGSVCIKGRAPLAVDTESDSMYRYHERVCLVQFTFGGSDYIVDPLAVDISPLGEVFADESVEKIFHAAEYDLMSLKRGYGFGFANIFDTMVAARILGWEQYGLGAILQERFGVKVNKKMQLYNWGLRPLSEAAVHYARMDTHYLPELREIQAEELKQRRRLREAREAFERVTKVEPTPKEFDPEGFWRIKGAHHVSPKAQAILRELYLYRDRRARSLKRPPFKVMNDSVLLNIAKTNPNSFRDLERISGLGRSTRQREGRRILKAVAKGRREKPPKYKHNNHYDPHRPDAATLSRYGELREWRKKTAAERGVEPDVVLSNDTLMAVARKNPRTLQELEGIDALGEWQIEAYGKSLLEVLKHRRRS